VTPLTHWFLHNRVTQISDHVWSLEEANALVDWGVFSVSNIGIACFAIRDFVMVVFIVILSGIATEGLIKGRLRGSRSWMGLTYRRTAPIAFWSGVVMYYAVAILIALVLIFGFPKWMTQQIK